MKPAKKIVICETVKLKSGIGLTLPPSGDKPPELGRVLYIGEGKKPVEFEVGDTIVYMKYSDNKVDIKGQIYNFIEFRNIVAVLPKE